jgi:hypothetical protein
MYMAYHAMFYAYQRLPADVPHDKVYAMCQTVVPGFQRSWLLAKGELSPLWTPITLGTASPVVFITNDRAAAINGTPLGSLISSVHVKLSLRFICWIYILISIFMTFL